MTDPEHEQLMQAYDEATKQRKHAQDLYAAARTNLEEKQAIWVGAGDALTEYERRHKSQ